MTGTGLFLTKLAYARELLTMNSYRILLNSDKLFF